MTPHPPPLSLSSYEPPLQTNNPLSLSFRLGLSAGREAILTVTLASFPISCVRVLILVRKDAVAMKQPFVEVANVFVTVRVCVRPLPVPGGEW